MITITDITKIDEMLACLNDSIFFTCLDFWSGYYHIKLSLETKKCFATIFSKYEFLRTVFGLVQGPVYFTALVQKVLGQFFDFCFFHVDDGLVHDSSENDHVEH